MLSKANYKAAMGDAVRSDQLIASKVFLLKSKVDLCPRLPR